MLVHKIKQSMPKTKSDNLFVKEMKKKQRLKVTSECIKMSLQNNQVN